MTEPQPLVRKVLYRDIDYTEMWVDSAKAFARQLIRDGKGFKCEPLDDGGWMFTVYEENWPTKWEIM